MSDPAFPDDGQVWKAIDGTVVDWDHKTQINPNTGEVYDFGGNLLKAAVKESK